MPKPDENFDSVKVVSEPQAIEIVGLSARQWYRMKAEGDLPPVTRLSRGRIGYRLTDIAQWLDKRREISAA